MQNWQVLRTKVEALENDKKEKKGDTVDPEETSTQTTTELADSDTTSNITTEQEDISERRDSFARRMLQGFWDSRQTSSFIQRILYEDSCAGVAVVDLFVALKRAKDEVDVLARLNNEIVGKIRDLSLEAGAAKREYKVLSRHMQLFLEKTEADIKALISKPSPTMSNLKESVQQTPEESAQKPDTRLRLLDSSSCTSQNTQTVDLYCSCKRGLWIKSDQLQSLGCVGDFIKPSATSVSISLKELVGALLLGGEDNSFKTDTLPVEIYMMGFCEEDLNLKKSEDKMDEPSVKMICGVDRVEAQNEAEACSAETTETKAVDEPGESCETTLSTSQKSTYISEDSSSSIATFAKTSESCELFCWNCGTKGLKEWMPKCQNCGKDAWTNPFAGYRLEPDEEPMSEGESIFEEALSEPYIPKLRASVTCMGDLTKAAKEKKSASTLTANSDAASSWIGKLTEDIKSKILNLKPFKKKQLVEEKLGTGAVTCPGAVEFKITANTPVGVFDVTVTQYKDAKEIPEFSVGLEDTPTVTTSTMIGTANPKPVTGFVTNIKGEDFYWSDESLTQSESEPMEASCNSEDELEEFADVNTNRPKQNKKLEEQPPSPLPPPRQAEKYRLAQETLKTKKAPFFEIQKCHPKHFVQEIVPKTAQNRPDKKDGIITLLEGGKVTEGIEHKLVIEDSADDLVIYIQVEVEGTECTSENKVTEEVKGLETPTLSDSRESEDDSDISVREELLRKKIVTFIDETSELMMEKEIRLMLPEEDAREWCQAVIIDTLDNIQTANIFLPQNQQEDILRIEPKTAEEPKPATPPSPSQTAIKPDNIELERALTLIRDIENDIIEVKLSDAISILPNLESELRKHLQHKMKTIADRESHLTASVDNFLSAAQFWSGTELPDDGRSYESEERLRNLLSLLTDLEEAVKTNEIFKDQIELCDHNSSKIYQLLHALANNIRELEVDATVVSLAETLDIASELDTAVREYDSIVRKQPLEYVTPEKEKKKRGKGKEPGSEGKEMSVKEHLKNVRKRVFEIVKEEAVETEGRLERDFDRIDRLERENEEAMKFVEAFLEKTERRTAELNSVKIELRELSSVLNEMYLELVKVQSFRNSAQSQQQAMSNPLRDDGPPAKEVPVRDSVSGLLLALNDLKSRAREKKEVCKGILNQVSNDSTSGRQLVRKSSRSSRSSYTAKHSDGMLSSVKEFRQIGQSSVYLSWTKPEGVLAESIIGYEILVNGKLNQKVRNPQRLQAVLYSVNLSEETEVQLFAIVENEPRLLLSTVTYLNT